jgi:hypothetical protein
VDWINLAEDRDSWWSPVNTVMKFRFLKCGEFLDCVRYRQFKKGRATWR